MGRPRKNREIPGDYSINVADVTNQIYPEGTPRSEDGSIANSGEISVDEARAIGAVTAESAQTNKETAKRVQLKRAGEKRVPWNDDNAMHVFHSIKDAWPLQGIMVYTRRTEPMPSEDFRPFSASLCRTGQDLYDYIAKNFHRNNASSCQYELRFKDVGGQDRGKGHLLLPGASNEMQQQGSYDPMQNPPFPPIMPNAFPYGAPHGAPQNPYPSPYPNYPPQYGYPAPFGMGAAPPQMGYPPPYQGVPGPGMPPPFSQAAYPYPQEAPQSVPQSAPPPPAPAAAAPAAPAPPAAPMMDPSHFGMGMMPGMGYGMPFQQPPAPPPQPSQDPAMMGHIASTYQEVQRMQQMMMQVMMQNERALGTIEEMRRNSFNGPPQHQYAPPPPPQQQAQVFQPSYPQQAGTQNQGVPQSMPGLPNGAPMPPGFPGASAMPGSPSPYPYQGQQQPYQYQGYPYPPQYGPPTPPVDPMVQAQTQINQSMGMIASLTKSMEQIKHMFNPSTTESEYDDPEPIAGVPTPSPAVPPPFNVMSLGGRGMVAHNNDGSLNMWGTAIGNLPTIMEGVKSLGEVFGKAQQAEQARTQSAQAQAQAYTAAMQAHQMGIAHQPQQIQPIQRHEPQPLPQYAPQPPMTQIFQQPMPVAPQEPIEPMHMVVPKKASVSCLPSMDVIMSTMGTADAAPSSG